MSNNIYLLWHEQHQLHLIPLLTWVLLCTNHNKSYKPYLWKFVLKLNCIPNLLLKKLYYVKDLLSKLDRSSTIILISRLPVNFPNKAISPCIWSIRCFRPPSYTKYNHLLQLKLSQSHILKQITSIRRQRTLPVLS